VIKPNAASDELSSPFFLKNEATCLKWEEFALKNGGTIQGTYNAWSYKVYLKINTPQPWFIIVSRATYTSGNLLLSSKYQSVDEKIVLKTKIKSNVNFTIKMSRPKDYFSLRRRKKLKISNSYSVIGVNNLVANPPFEQITETLALLFKKKHVFSVKLNNYELVITLRDSNENYQVVQSLIDLSLN
jgi:hypothetical protein